MKQKKVVSEFEFKLEVPIAFQTPAGLDETSILILRAPSSNDRKKQRILQQYVMRAFKSMASLANNSGKTEDTEDSEGSEMTGQEILTVLLMSNIDYSKIDDVFCNLLPNVCYVNKEIKITSLLVKKINNDDLLRLTGEYMSNFIIPSWMKQTNNK